MAQHEIKSRRIRLALAYLAVAISLAIISAVCWHSVGEIHYLKKFYPPRFSVEEAFYASAVELVKVFIISIPFLFIILTALGLLHAWNLKARSEAEPEPPARPKGSPCDHK